MSDEKPRKTLALKPKTVTPATDNADTPAKPLTRSGKRIITRDQLTGVQKPGTPKTAPKKPPKPKNKKPRRPPKPKKTPPSDLRAHELDASLNNFLVWLNYQPLAIGIEKQIFQHTAQLHLSSSKRVVQKLLQQHTRHERYRDNLAKGGMRYNLDGSEAGAIQFPMSEP